MLQQTQVATVLDYFSRFTLKFPTVRDLANASLDEVMGLWSGLGYYSRARNLHRCAQAIANDWGGHFPSNSAQLQTLPGIGRSTAAAIAATCFGERVSILDGNAKRVVARYLGFEGNIALPAMEKQLWAQAASLLPPPGANCQALMPTYTQGLMDLGAQVCTPRKPVCDQCPVQTGCAAKAFSRQDHLPFKQKALRRTHASHHLLWLRRGECDNAETLWVRRPLKGIWAGLLCLPVFDSELELLQSLPAPLRKRLQSGPVVSHALTHKELRLHFYTLEMSMAQAKTLALACSGQWLHQADWSVQGIPAPVRRVVQSRQVPGGV
jgi:A/G-specific adenine glycosylase